MLNNKELQLNLLEWYDLNKRDLPWRLSLNPYHVWISEVMLQQTTVETVKRFFSRFMSKFPSLEILANSDEDSVIKVWSGLGYYSRARNILKTAQIILCENNFPCDFESLLRLPGIGYYTAGAISSISFNQAVSAVDVNVERVLSRVFGYKRTDKSFCNNLLSLANQLVSTAPQGRFGDWNQSLIELGALICKARSAYCEVCPIASFCLAKKSENLFLFPGAKMKKIKQRIEVVDVIWVEGQVVLRKIVLGNLRRGLYDFPLACCDPDESDNSLSYQVSNSKIHRFFRVFEKSSYKLQKHEVFCDPHLIDEYPLTFPCKKYLSSKLNF